ncbi:MAG TPA: FAD-dependent oxidoreductase [Candidatus Dormibacteraeota bacterium]|nr:FAD-dependent oxidoreductase [Candidatus Dormibacteraeota bacterium]
MVEAMGEEEKFDAIVVGAGPAGVAAAITMAKAGLQVVLIEKGSRPGAKNVMGGILYKHMLEEIVGPAWASAPVERPIIEEQRWLMTPDAALRFGHRNLRNRLDPHSFSVLRARFDPWFAEQAEAAGVFLINETLVSELIVNGGGVIGVKTGREDDLLADVVVVCEGIGLGSKLLQSAGLKAPVRPDQVAMAVKEVLKLDADRIEARFNCDHGEGATVECYGDATMGMAGFMFIYTNRDTLSVGGGALLKDFVDSGRSPNQLLEHFKAHPLITPLLEGAETVEFSAKMIPEAGYRGIPKLFGDGYLVCGDAAMLSNPVHREGSNLAMTSGRLAGETVIEAKARGDFSARSLASYRRRLEKSWVLPDMRKYDRAVPLLENNPRLLSLYPNLADRAVDEFLRVDGVSKWAKQKKIFKMFRREGGVRMVVDMAKALWTLK